MIREATFKNLKRGASYSLNPFVPAFDIQQNYKKWQFK